MDKSGQIQNITGGRTISRLGVGGHLLHVGLLVHHLLEVNIATDGILVTVLSGVDAGSIRRVALESLEGVEVLGRARGIGIKGGVDVLLGGVVPELIVVLSVLKVEVGGETSASEGGCEGRGTGGQGKDGGRVPDPTTNPNPKKLTLTLTDELKNILNKYLLRINRTSDAVSTST